MSKSYRRVGKKKIYIYIIYFIYIETRRKKNYAVPPRLMFILNVTIFFFCTINLLKYDHDAILQLEFKKQLRLATTTY